MHTNTQRKGQMNELQFRCTSNLGGEAFQGYFVWANEEPIHPKCVRVSIGNDRQSSAERAGTLAFRRKHFPALQCYTTAAYDVVTLELKSSSPSQIPPSR